MAKKKHMTIEHVREQNRLRRKKYYENNKEKVKQENRDRYHKNKLDKKMP